MPKNWKGKIYTSVCVTVGGAPSAVAYNLSGDERMSYNSGRTMPVGNFIVIPMLWNAFTRIEAGEFSADTAVAGMPMLKAFEAVRDGDDDIAAAILDFLGAENVEHCAHASGMLQTELRAVPGSAGADLNVTCADDIALCLKKIALRDGLGEESCKAIESILVPGKDSHLAKALHEGDKLICCENSRPGSEYAAGICTPAGEQPIIVAAMVMLLPHQETGVEFCEKVGKAVFGD